MDIDNCNQLSFVDDFVPFTAPASPAQEEIVKSVYSDQQDILRAIAKLHCGDWFDADISYGKGSFWKGIKEPALKFDIDPQKEGVINASSAELPIESGTLGAVVFDPPFLTYVRSGRNGNGKMIMAGQFSGYWRYDELEKHYRETLAECRRILMRGGVLVFKCQDIIHNHKMHCTHANVIEWAEEQGMRLADLFILPAKHRLPSPNRAGKQKHARIFHSFFLVFKNEARKPQPSKPGLFIGRKQ